MSDSTTAAATPLRSLSEDWLATIIGLVLVLIIGIGVLGPGAQNVVLTVKAGERGDAKALGITGWQASATVGGEKASLSSPPLALQNGKTYLYTCTNGELTVEEASAPVDGVKAPSTDRAQLVIVNDCDKDVVLTYKTNPSINWPIFGLLGK